MEKLLQWSIAQQTGDKEAIAKAGTPDPKSLDQLFGLGGPDEPALMKQAIIVATNPEATLENQEIALENFEMLIENLDNANNIENIKLWPSIISQLEPHVPTSLRVYAASIIGIAVQNNPLAQKAFLSHEQGLKSLVLTATPTEPKELYLKALFAISSLIRNDEEACKKFLDIGGWKVVEFDNTVAAKQILRVLSVLSAILSTGLDANKEKEIHSRGIVAELVSVLQSSEPHVGCIDKVLNIVTQLHRLGFKFTASELEQLESSVSGVLHLKDQLSEEDLEAVKTVWA
ncbi:hsp70 nucleotide exchange factor Fes1p [[Candida] anglica]|uniref:Hsp70 nucleotide exchange factor FES1 n=1 Tax=[Candida] anglica TaxID=148631 RepID=A0ABP0EJV5_9ASCO